MSKIRALSRRKKVFLSIITLSLLIILAIGTVNAVVIPPGQVNAAKVAEANGDGTYDVEIDVTGEPFSTGEEAGRYDVVLVIDRSTSMNSDMDGSSGSRLDAAKSAAISFVETILGDDANDNNRVALVSFGTNGQQVRDFTDNIGSLTNAINDLNAGSGWNAQYTNIQEGLIYARDYIDNDADDAANKIVILLSDGEPTRSVNDLYWNNNDNGYVNRFLNKSQMADDWYPSNFDQLDQDYNNDGSGFTAVDRYFDRIIVEANKIRSLGADIYTVGINADDNMKKALGADANFHFSRNNGVAAWRNGGTTYEISYPYDGQATHGGGYLIPGFDDFEVDYATAYYTTNDANELEDIFEGFMQDFSTVATNGVVTDVLPEYFNPVLPLPSGASYNSNTRTITWNVGSIGDKKTLEYTVTPVDGYDGEGYTNDDTVTLTATAVDDNPYYDTDPAISINILDPTRYDQAVINDQYEGSDDTVNGVDRKTPINIPEDDLLDNDSVKTLHYVTRNSSDTADEIAYNVAAHACLLSGGSYDPLYGTVVQNTDGSFTYSYDDVSHPYDINKTVDYFYYYLSDPDTGNPNGTDSEPIKVTINLKELATVTAEYRNYSATPDPNTGEYPKIVGDKEIVKQVDETVVYGDVERNLLDPDPSISFTGGFIYDHGVPELNSAGASYTVVSGTNTLVLYYVSSECKVDVYFKDAAAPHAILSPMQTLTGTYGESYASDLEDLEDNTVIPGYTHSDTDNPNGSTDYALTNQDITLYYTAKTLNTTIHYVDVTGLTANPDGSYTGGSAITGYPDESDSGKIDEDIDYTVYTINGYNHVGTFGSDTFTDPEHDIYVYYTKKTDLEVTIKYVLDSDHSQLISAPGFTNPVKKTGTFGDEYSYDTPEFIGGYEYVDEYDPNGGVYKDPCDTVYVYYTERETSVTVKYQEYDTGTTLKDDELIEGHYNDEKTVDTDDITGDDGYLYTYHSIDNPYNAGSDEVTLKMDMTDPIIVYMVKVPETIDVHFLEKGTTSPKLASDEELSGYVGGSYAVDLQNYEDTTIPGFTYDSTDGANVTQTYTKNHGDITIYYTRIETTITVLHKYTDDDSYFGSTDERDGDYEDTTSIDPITPKDGYDFVGYEVDTDEGNSLTAYDGSEVDAEFGLADYTVTMLYAPTTGTVNVHYLEVGTSIGDTALHTPDSYHGNYEYKVIDIDPETGEETERTVPAEKFYGSQVDPPSVTGFHLTGDVELDGADFSDDTDYTEFEEDAQDIIVWYARDNITLPLEHVDESGNKLADDETISGDYGTSFTDEATAKIKTDIEGYTYKEMQTTNLSADNLYPSPVPDGAIVSLVYEKKPVILKVKYVDNDSGDEIAASTTMPEDGSNGYYGESFTMPTAPTITGYTFDRLVNPHMDDTDPYDGTYPDPADKEDIVYYYDIKEVSVDINYVEVVDGDYVLLPQQDDEDNPYRIKKDFGSSYSIPEREYTGFTYDETINENGSKMSENMSTIYVVYTRNSYEAEVRYVEASDYTNEIATSADISGPYGSAYADQMPANPSIHGWTQDGDIDYPNADAVFTDDEVQIIYVPYTRDTMDMTLRYQLVGSTPEDDDIQDPYEFSGPYGIEFSLDNSEGLFDIFGYTLYTQLPITGTYQDEVTTLYAYYQKNFYSYDVEYRYTGDGSLLDSDVVSGYYGDSYNVEIKSFPGYKYDRTDDPFGGEFSDENEGEEVITVWYDRRGGGHGGDDDDEDEDDGGGGDVTEDDDDTPYEPPVIEEPVDEEPPADTEEEIPDEPIPATGGTMTYLIPLLGVALIAAGTFKLIRSKKS